MGQSNLCCCEACSSPASSEAPLSGEWSPGLVFGATVDEEETGLVSRERDAGFASPSDPGDVDAFWSLPRKERARLLWAMLLVRSLPPRIAAADPAIARRARLWTWMGYGYFAFSLWLMIEHSAPPPGCCSGIIG